MKNHWEGKLWYAYGTSMTSVEQGKFVPVVEALSGMRVVNKGIGGGCLTPDGYGKGNNKKAVMTLEDGKDKADLITLEVLPNEGCVVGNIYDTDDKSFCGCFNQCIRYLQENTKAQIVVIIMIGGNNHEPDVPCESRGITCLYEPQGMYFNGIKGLKGLVDKLKANGRKVGVCADFGNSLFVDEAPDEVIGAFIDDVRHVHVKDYVASSEPINGIVDLKSKGGKYLYHSELGTGVANVDACFELLKKVGYSGNISFEINVNDGEMKKSMDIVRKKLG